MARRIIVSLGAITALLLLVAGWNWAGVHRPLSEIVAADPRNEGLVVRAHYGSYINPKVVVLDLRDVGQDMSPMDVTRTLLQFAESMKDRDLEQVVLAHRGDPRFVLPGDYFRTLGQEYGTQNPMYTVRTLPENLRTPDGGKPFGTWTGGILGVLSGQLEDFNAFHARWYIEDMARENAGS